LSQDDSDNDAPPMDVVEILDSPVLAERPLQQLDVDRFARLFNNEASNHRPLSLSQHATASTPTPTPATFLTNQPLLQPTASTPNNNWLLNERQDDTRHRTRQNRSHHDNALRFSSASSFYNLPDSNAQSDSRSSTHPPLRHYHVQQQSIPIHHASQQQSTRVIHDNSTTHQSAAATFNVRSPIGIPIISERLPPQNSNISRSQQRNRSRGRRSNRRRAYAGAAVAHEGNQAMQRQRLLSLVQQISQGQMLHRLDITNALGGHLLNFDNLSYEDLLSIFGNGSENCGASVTDMSLLPVIAVTKDDVISTESATSDGTRDQEDADNNNKYCCSVCLQNYRLGEYKKILPCFHNFHESCIDQWLLQNGSCPICKHRISGLS
jgi:hypothetical protein